MSNVQTALLTAARAEVSKIKNNEHWWYHVLPALAAEPFTPSATDLLGRIASKKYNIEGVTIEGKLIIATMKFIHQVKRGSLVKSQTKTPAISSGTPWVLYAYKHQHGIPYEKWDKTDPKLGYLLGEDLEWLPEFHGIAVNWTKEELLEYRLSATTEKVSKLVKPPTAYKMNRVGDPDFDELPRLFKFMILQTWIYHITTRSDAMILNWNDWDAPPPYELDSGDLPKALSSDGWNDLLDGFSVSKVTTGRIRTGGISKPSGDDW